MTLPPTIINTATAIYALKVTQDGMSRPTDPCVSGFYYYDAHMKRGRRYGGIVDSTISPVVILFLISTGNCFATREEAEDEGKWRFETKLVLEEKLRKAGFQLRHCQNDGAYVELDCGLCVLLGEYLLLEDFDKVREILGSNAKRYLTGEK